MIDIGLCHTCGKEIYPYRLTCPNCRNKLTQIQVPVTGTVLSWCTIFIPPEGYGPEPYTIALIKITNSTAKLLSKTIVPNIKVGDNVVLSKQDEDWTIVDIQ